MQKKIIALAVAAVASSAAFAQSNVTVYGIVDAYAGVIAADGIKNSTQINGGGLSTSRLGFKGVEDLGGGNKALFVLEYGLSNDQNVSLSGTARQQLLGLTGSWGTVAAGRLQTAGYDWAVAYDVTAGTAVSPLQNFTTSRGLIGATNATAARANNAVAYISPSFNGLTLAVNYTTQAGANESVIGADATDNTNVRATLMSAKYDNGPLSIGAVYANGKSDTTTNLTDVGVGVSYAFSAATVKATYQTSKNNAADTDADRVYSVGAVVPVSAAGAVVASYANLKRESIAADNESKGWTLGYLHNLSKRTTLYAAYSAVVNQAGNAYTVGNNMYGSSTVSATNPAGVAVAGGAGSNIVAAGVRHSF